MAIQNLTDRAKIFMPFDALKGYREALRAKERTTVPKTALSPEALKELDRKIKQVHPGMNLNIIYYHNGTYREESGIVTSIRYSVRRLILGDCDIHFDDIREIFSDEFISDIPD